jgi:hypothetical protein
MPLAPNGADGILIMVSDVWVSHSASASAMITKQIRVGLTSNLVPYMCIAPQGVVHRCRKVGRHVKIQDGRHTFCQNTCSNDMNDMGYPRGVVHCSTCTSLLKSTCRSLRQNLKMTTTHFIKTSLALDRGCILRL